MSKPTPIATERALVKQFLGAIGTPCGGPCRAVTTEFDYQSGRTDVLALSSAGELVAFEAKLSDWRKALHQAWRNTSYAQRAFVVMPKKNAASAIANLSAFVTLGVGFCVVDGTGLVTTLVDSSSFDPVIPWLHQKARLSLEQRAAKSASRRRRSAHLRLQALCAGP